MTPVTAIDVAFDLWKANDPEWDAACTADDDDRKAGIVRRWQARLVRVAERRGVTVDFVPVGSPEAHAWNREHVHSDDDAEAVAELAMALWGDVT